MNQAELNKKADQLLSEFETLGNIEASTEWNDALMAKITNTPRNTSSQKGNGKYMMLVLCFILTNLGFTFTYIHKNNSSSDVRQAQLALISQELLITPNAKNN
jgi:hypothetical protein